MAFIFNNLDSIAVAGQLPGSPSVRVIGTQRFFQLIGGLPGLRSRFSRFMFRLTGSRERQARETHFPRIGSWLDRRLQQLNGAVRISSCGIEPIGGSIDVGAVREQHG